jgi:hypothetical protein
LGKCTQKVEIDLLGLGRQHASIIAAQSNGKNAIKKIVARPPGIEQHSSRTCGARLAHCPVIARGAFFRQLL